MLSRRDKLLIRPWQQRRFENHRRKVQTALPAIDNRSPPLRQHIDVNLKKQQIEMERCAKIEKENMILLRRLNYVMKTNRVNNYWRTPQPNFLNRVAIDQTSHRSQEYDSYQSSLDETLAKCSHRLKCSACMTKKVTKANLAEERVPWEPEKIPVSTRLRSKSVPARLTLPIITEKEEIKKTPIRSRHKSGKSDITTSTQCNKDELAPTPQSIIISRGALKLAVNFPPDSSIMFRNGSHEKLLMHNHCNCKLTAAPAVF